jgi:hypothetical protein
MPEQSRWLLGQLSVYLNDCPRAITAQMVGEMTAACGITEKEAFALLLAALLGLDLQRPRDRALYHRFFPAMLRQLDAAQIAQDPYYRNVRVPARREGRWRLYQESYAPYEAFVCDDLRSMADGGVTAQIGFFDRPFSYPAVSENGRLWMSVTPNEIATMQRAISAAQGRVLTYGLGLGYFAYHAARKPSVASVTVVERDRDVIRLFEKYLLAQFPCREKVRIVCDDAFAFARTQMCAGHYDVVFTDLWHDPSDGVALYRAFKPLEAYSPSSRFLYWIEDTLQYYL